MPLYLFQFNHQPKFHWDQQRLSRSLGDLRYRQGRLLGGMEMLGSPLHEGSGILGSAAHGRIGNLPGGIGKLDSPARAAGNDEVEHYDRLLTEERLLEWHGGSWRNAVPGRRWHRSQLHRRLFRYYACGDQKIPELVQYGWQYRCGAKSSHRASLVHGHSAF